MHRFNCKMKKTSITVLVTKNGLSPVQRLWVRTHFTYMIYFNKNIKKSFFARTVNPTCVFLPRVSKERRDHQDLAVWSDRR